MDLTACPPLRPAVRARMAAGADAAPLLAAAWRRFVILHYALPPDVLALPPPLRLETCGGRAWVSLLSFRLEGLRPAAGVPAPVGRALLRPVSEHEFLNVRTYVRGSAGPGIYFLAEWIDHPLCRRLGPLCYGLPYRMARITCDDAAGGLRRAEVRDADTGAALRFALPVGTEGPPAPCAPGSLDEFLMERYTAYTHRRGVTRHFFVRHAPWRLHRADGVRCDPRLLAHTFPWFRDARFSHAHRTDGFEEVLMGPPVRD